MSGLEPASSPAEPRRAPRWSTFDAAAPPTEVLPASIAGLPASRAMVWVGPPPGASEARPGFFTLLRMLLMALRPPEPPVPNRSKALVGARLPIASLAEPPRDVLRATIVLYRVVVPLTASRPPAVPLAPTELRAMVT